MTTLSKRRWMFLVVGLVILASLFASFLHQHANGPDFEHCSVCKFVRQIVSFFVFALVVFFSQVQPRFLAWESDRPSPLFTPSQRRNRAPPFFV